MEYFVESNKPLFHMINQTTYQQSPCTIHALMQCKLQQLNLMKSTILVFWLSPMSTLHPAKKSFFTGTFIFVTKDSILSNICVVLDNWGPLLSFELVLIVTFPNVLLVNTPNPKGAPQQLQPKLKFCQSNLP